MHQMEQSHLTLPPQNHLNLNQQEARYVFVCTKRDALFK